MLEIQTKLTSQGQVSVPAAVRNFLNLAPGSMLVWKEQAGQISVERAVRHNTVEVHQALFGAQANALPSAKTSTDIKQGIRQLMLRRHAGR